MPINNGTDGWREVISDTITIHNLRLDTQAIEDARPYVEKAKAATTQAVEKAKPYAEAARKATTQAAEKVKEKIEDLTDDD